MKYMYGKLIKRSLVRGLYMLVSFSFSTEFRNKHKHWKCHNFTTFIPN